LNLGAQELGTVLHLEASHLVLFLSVCIHNNQNEALNGGGTLFVNKHPDLRVRVVHGNTLTAAVILNEIPSNVKEVFMTGATSKLGRAIALYLCRKKIRVLVIHTYAVCYVLYLLSIHRL
jgi:hypothetical protein